LALAGVTIDSCPQCGGTWFDPGELEPAALGLPDRQAADPVTARPWEGEPYACPRCGEELFRYWYAAEPGRTFLVDGCRAGHGVWLDAGELDRAHDVLRRFAELRRGFVQSGRLDDVLDRLEQEGLGARLRQAVTDMVRAWLGR